MVKRVCPNGRNCPLQSRPHLSSSLRLRQRKPKYHCLLSSDQKIDTNSARIQRYPQNAFGEANSPNQLPAQYCVLIECVLIRRCIELIESDISLPHYELRWTVSRDTCYCLLKSTEAMLESKPHFVPTARPIGPLHGWSPVAWDWPGQRRQGDLTPQRSRTVLHVMRLS